jgi:hypothetical protein
VISAPLITYVGSIPEWTPPGISRAKIQTGLKYSTAYIVLFRLIILLLHGECLGLWRDVLLLSTYIHMYDSTYSTTYARTQHHTVSIFLFAHHQSQSKIYTCVMSTLVRRSGRDRRPTVSYYDEAKHDLAVRRQSQSPRKKARHRSPSSSNSMMDVNNDDAGD